MSDWVAKRFWKTAAPIEDATGFLIGLDGRQVKTPAKAALCVPTRSLADAIAAEWDAQVGKIDPTTMPFTRMANSALDKVTPQKDAVVAMLAEYGGTDLLCYRALGQDDLEARQKAAWDPILIWAAQKFNAPLAVTNGVIPIDQPAESLTRLHAEVATFDAFQIAAFHDLVAISGSLVLALGVTHGRLSGADAWDVSRVDETFQSEAWGVDEEAEELAAFKREALLHAEQFWAMCS
ncbi:ATP12 family chaperone protein [Albirhodobacter sp. R86504]|uniref:ATP12 family chaperone protein n=1 Tax=Albirhodobacter sp. R86504 TaxID=3093848 RepID=UPI0036722CF4